MLFNSELLESMVTVFGPSSQEDYIRNFIKNEIKDHVDDIEVDNLGNLIARKKGPGKKIMIAAHMDQIGMMIIDIDKNGFLRFTNVGGLSPSLLIGQKIVFSNGTVGLIASEPVKPSDDLKLENLFIDIGAKSKEDAEKLVNIGDICVYKEDFTENQDVIISPYLDDRVGCFIAVEAIKNITNPANDLYFVFTVQEEVGLRGAKTSAYSINPDIGISIDVTIAGDTPKAKRLPMKLHEGAAIKVKDGSLITSPFIKNKLIKLARDNNITYQMEILEGAGTDSGAIHLTRSGVPSGVISIPSRYVHSSVEMVSKEDVENSRKLLEAFIGSEF